MLLSIIIISYNTADITLQTLNSVETDLLSSPKLSPLTEIIIIDNDSQDNSIAQIKSFATSSRLKMTIIANKSNNGFAAANNQGIAKATGQFVLLLNSDTIVESAALQLMVDAMLDHPVQDTTADLISHHHQLDRVGILAAHLLNTDGSTQYQGGSFPSLLSLFIHMTFLDDIPILGKLLPSTQHTGLRAVPSSKAPADKTAQFSPLLAKDWVAGTAMLLRQTMIDEIGTLDEDIFMYGEDIEYCLRAQNHHWDVALHPTASITHLGSASSSSKNAIIGEMIGYLHIWTKHKPAWQYQVVKQILMLGCRLRILLFGIIIKDHDRANIYHQALDQVKSAT
jgi:GT2 family glycosyltransferase